MIIPNLSAARLVLALMAVISSGPVLLPAATALTSSSTGAAASETLLTPVRLDEIIEGEHDWRFDNGREFAGAKGGLTVVNDGPQAGASCLQLSADFTGGGAYVQILKDLKPMGLGGDLADIRLKVKSDNVRSIGVRLIDGTGQCHQAKDIPIVADDQWHDLVLKPSDIAGGEHWGGANDGKWHGPAGMVCFLLTKSKENTPRIQLADVTANVLVSAVVQASSFKSDFKTTGPLPQGWKTQGNVSIDAKQAFQSGGHSLLLQRLLDNVESPTDAFSPAFPVTPGFWDLGFATKADLVSPDSSFRALVRLEFLDGAGSVVDRLTLADIFGTHPWQPVSKRVESPLTAVSARFRVDLQKTWGEFRVADLSAAFIATAPRKDDRINRMYFVGADPTVGHFLYPEEPKVFTVKVEATKPLPPEQLVVSCLVRDYWGAEQGDPVKVQLTRVPGKTNRRFVYSGTLDLSSVSLKIGRYYEIHGEIARAGNDPYRNHSSFVIQPEAVANSHKAADVPFTGRNWEGRLPQGFTMSRRLGIRTMNIWSDWAPTPPYKPGAPCINLVKKFEMGAIFATPVGKIESHGPNWEKYDEKALREGVRNLITTYRSFAEPFIISLGNEPPPIPERIAANVEAYRIVYDEAKKVDPTVIVLGTSIGGHEEFFEAGFGQWCDAYDFHLYESPESIARAVKQYDELFKKYGHPKPIWSTEIGVNSQGVSRRTVAIDMIKKTTLFFAAGGESFSWFDLFYPDPDAKNADSSSSAHDVFDSRYVQYAPKLTALTLYNLINGICIKKFVEKKSYDDGVQSFLFRDRDNRQLQIIWKEKGRRDVFVPLSGVQALEVIRIDGTQSKLNARGKGVTLTVSEEPLLLLHDGAVPLAVQLDAPAATVTVPQGLVRGAATPISVVFSDTPTEQVNVEVPPFWKVEKNTSGNTVTFTVTSPETSTIREADLAVTLADNQGVKVGELYLRPPVTGQLSATIRPVPVSDGQEPAVKLLVKNNGATAKEMTWDLSFTKQIALVAGQYRTPGPVAEARFLKPAKGEASLNGGETKEFIVPLAGIDFQTAYGIHATVSDAEGHAVNRERNIAGFVGVPKATGEIKLDGTLDSPDWARASVQKIDEPRQFFTFDVKAATWTGPEDLSANVRFLWDNRYLYVGVEVTDDLPGDLMPVNGLWKQDGLQFLVDPCRAMDESVGKYDYSLGIGKNGPGAWCSLSADPQVPTGAIKEIIVSGKRVDPKTGSITYVVAFPWSRLSPFQPSVGANLGLTLILNEDDGEGRKSFMTWFGNAHTKQVDAVGDLILMP